MSKIKFTKFDIGVVHRPSGSKDEKDSSFSKSQYQELIRSGRKVSIAGKASKRVVIPFIAVVLSIMMLLQSMVYLSSARNAQGEILGAATSAYSDLSSAGDNLKDQNFSGAQSMFNSAYNNLQAAQDKLNEFKALQVIAPQAKSADHVLSGASLLAAAGRKLTLTLGLFDELKVDASGINDINLTSKLQNNKDSMDATLFLLKQAQGEFDLATNLPGSYADTLAKAKEQVNALTGMLSNMVNLEDIYLGMFGKGPKTYLLIFQNYDEVRATGGFIGTYGVLKIDGGKIQSLKIDSIYDLDGQIYQRIAAPGPFQPDIKKWGIRDANWFADFPASAKKLLYFFEAGSQTADGVIAMSPNFFENVLSLTGPIPMPEYGVTLTPDNFQEVVQFKTSVDYNKKLNQPKKFLADAAPVILNKLTNLDKEKWLELLQMFQTNLNQKQIMLYSTDPQLQQKISADRFSGEILPSTGDYLDVVNTNLGGTKTDLKISQDVNLKSVINSDGSIIDTLTITRANTAAALNKDYIRILVPSGSALISSAGFEAGTFEPSEAEGFRTDADLQQWDSGIITADGRVLVHAESGKTEFSGWTISNPGETKTLTLVYTIPYRINPNFLNPSQSYSLLFQKQDGIRPYTFSAQLDPHLLKPKWFTSDTTYESGSINFVYTSGSD